MATSGTIDLTVVETSKVLEHALRRCGVPVVSQTPEIVDIALENLYLLLLALSNRGLNLWAVDRRFVGLNASQATYVLPAGTIDVLNVVYSRPTQATGTDSSTASSYTTQLDDETTIVRVGVKLSALPTTVISFQYSDDGLSWTTAETIAVSDLTVGEYTWVAVDPQIAATYFRLTAATNFTVTTFFLASSVYDVLMTPFNSDDYYNQPNKQYTNRPVTNYYFEKLVNPQLTCWPVPSNGDDHLTVRRHRQVQDIGTLTQEIELPNRWYESVIWQLAERLAFEVPGVDAGRVSLVLQKAQEYKIEAEGNETDSAPVYFAPNIRAYTS